MTAQVQTVAATFWSLSGLFGRIRANTDALNAAHNARRQHLAVTDVDLKDVGLSRDEVVGSPCHQPDLPFFMQHDFQSHRL